MCTPASDKFPQGAALSNFQVKNTFIECDFDQYDDVMQLNHDFAKRQVSAPPTSSYTGISLDRSWAEKKDQQLAFSRTTDGDGTISERSEFGSVPGQSTTCDSLPEPEKESDPSPKPSPAQDMQQPMNGFVPMMGMNPMMFGAWSMPQMPLDAQVSAAAMQMAMAKLMSGGGAMNKPAAWDNVFTVMMRNLPNKFCQASLLEEINTAGFQGTYDFLYLPIDPDTDANRGYAFINFTNPCSAYMFKMHFEGKKFGDSNSRKVVAVMPATLQGFEANYAHYSQARVSQGDPASRPLFLRDPPQTKTHPGGRGKPQSLIDMAAKHVRRQQFQPQERKPRERIVASSPIVPAESSRRPSGKAQAKFCPYCGGTIQAHFKFCALCGENLDE